MPKHKKTKNVNAGMTPHEQWSRLPWKQLNETYGNNIIIIIISYHL